MWRGLPPAVRVSPIIRIGVSHAVDHCSQDGDPRTVELTSRPLDLRETANIVSRGKHSTVGISTQDQVHLEPEVREASR